MFKSTLQLLLLLAPSLVTITNAAFVSTSGGSAAFSTRRRTNRVQQPSSLNMIMLDDPTTIMDSVMSINAAASNMWLATVDSDIANISDNEFKTVFAGGIVVMFGGIASATIVGYLLESRDLYASVIADSYVQGGDDEEFWKGLSEEERKKAEEMLERLRASKEGRLPQTDDAAAATTAMATTAEPETKETAPKTPPKKVSKPTDMFSDYGES